MNNTTKQIYTPGPWASELDQGNDDLVVTKDAFEVCRIGSCYDIHTAQQNRGNATLIAAAPELLEALKAISARARAAIESDGEVFLHEADVYNLAEAALAKAEGR